MASVAEPLDSGEPVGVASVFERDDVVGLGGEDVVADLADRIPGEDRPAGQLPFLALVDTAGGRPSAGRSFTLDRFAVVVATAAGGRRVRAPGFETEPSPGPPPANEWFGSVITTVEKAPPPISRICFSVES